MKAGRPADALVAAVRSCGEILRAAGFTARPEDTNEIPDGLAFARLDLDTLSAPC